MRAAPAAASRSSYAARICGIRGSGGTKPTAPVEIALRGIPSYAASSGYCLGVHTGQRDRQARRSVDLSENLRAGIRRGELDLNYQTQVEIDTGRIVGLEALVRWKHPILGEIQPSIFVSLAERKGVIKALGHWVLDRACRQINEWEDEGLVVPRLAINVSGAQMRRPGDFEREVTESFCRWNIRPNAIELELTETVLMDVSQRQADALERLRELGATIAIDDFGTGSRRSNTWPPIPSSGSRLRRNSSSGSPLIPAARSLSDQRLALRTNWASSASPRVLKMAARRDF